MSGFFATIAGEIVLTFLKALALIVPLLIAVACVTPPTSSCMSSRRADS